MSLFWSGYRSGSGSEMGNYAAVAADGARAAASAAQETARDTDERVDQLLLVCAAMWELMCERTGVTQDELVARVAEIDARDGVADGKMTTHPRKCPQCARTVFPRHQKCLYCGSDVPVDSVFKTI